MGRKPCSFGDEPFSLEDLRAWRMMEEGLNMSLPPLSGPQMWIRQTSLRRTGEDNCRYDHAVISFRAALKSGLPETNARLFEVEKDGEDAQLQTR
jgi:hypothetical protein